MGELEGVREANWLSSAWTRAGSFYGGSVFSGTKIIEETFLIKAAPTRFHAVKYET